MVWSRGLPVWAAVLLGIAGVAGSASRAADQVDNGFESQDRRGAVTAASNVFVGQVVGERLYCLATSAPDLYVIYDHFLVKVERNVKGRAEGTVLVRQDTDDTLQYGPDGRLETGRKYLIIARRLSALDGYAIVDYTLGYVRIDGPEERAALVAEVRGYLAEPTMAVETPTPVPPDTRATWDAQSTRNAATQEVYPTPFPCGPEIVATATASAAYLDRENRALGNASRPPPENATPFPEP